MWTRPLSWHGAWQAMTIAVAFIIAGTSCVERTGHAVGWVLLGVGLLILMIVMAKLRQTERRERLSRAERDGLSEHGRNVRQYHFENIRGLEAVSAATPFPSEHVLRISLRRGVPITADDTRAYREAEQALRDLGWRVDGWPEAGRALSWA